MLETKIHRLHVVECVCKLHLLSIRTNRVAFPGVWAIPATWYQAFCYFVEYLKCFRTSTDTNIMELVYLVPVQPKQTVLKHTHKHVSHM